MPRKAFERHWLVLQRSVVAIKITVDAWDAWDAWDALQCSEVVCS